MRRAAIAAFLAFLSCSSPPATVQGPNPLGPVPTPAPTEDPVKVAVVGDFGTGDANEYAVSKAIRRWTRRQDAAALFTTGDNIYPDGSRQRFKAAWHRPYGWVARDQLPVHASLGNHDYQTDSGRPVMRLFDMPHRWYALTVGSARFLVLDGNQPSNERQEDWLRRKLQSTGARFKIVVLHQPPFSCGFHGNTWTIHRWLPIFERHNVDLVISGHDHSYQRFARREGVTYVISAGGGARLYRIGSCAAGTPKLKASYDDRHSFVTLRIAANAIRLRAISAAGRRLDSLRIR